MAEGVSWKTQTTIQGVNEEQPLISPQLGLTAGMLLVCFKAKAYPQTQQRQFKRTLLHCTEAVRMGSQTREVPRVSTHGESIPKHTATRPMGEPGADSMTAPMLHPSCGISLQLTWTSLPCRSQDSLQVAVTDLGSCLLLGSR